MKFGEPRTHFDGWKKLHKNKDVSHSVFYERYFDYIRPGEDSQEIMSRMMSIGLESSWYRAMRPYYKIWPSCLNALERFNLDMRLSGLNFAGRTIALRFPDEFTLPFHDECTQHEIKADSVLLSTELNIFPGEQLLFFRFGCEWRIGDVFAINLNRDETANSGLLEHSVFMKGKMNDLSSYQTGLKIILSVLLLADDPSIIEPDVLSKDELAYERTKDQKYVDKAHRRGKVGWHIGKTFESIPHYRRPHPALFHTGKGRTVPRIVFRSGCVVHRDKMTKVPTGYITPEGVEVEP